MTDNTKNESAVEDQDENTDSVSPLREACLAGLAEKVEQLLATQEWPREERQEALADAANSGDARCVRLSDGTTPLMEAFQLRQRDEHDGVVQPNVIQTARLLAGRSDLSLRDEDDLTALIRSRVKPRLLGRGRKARGLGVKKGCETAPGMA